MTEFRPFHYTMMIREHHLDTFGHVNNATYLQLLEEARWEILNKANYGIDHIRKTGLGPVILEIQIAFKHELFVRSEINIETKVESYDGLICILKQLIRDSSGRLCTEATFKMALFDVKARRLVLPTPEWLATLT